MCQFNAVYDSTDGILYATTKIAAEHFGLKYGTLIKRENVSPDGIFEADGHKLWYIHYKNKKEWLADNPGEFRPAKKERPQIERDIFVKQTPSDGDHWAKPNKVRVPKPVWIDDSKILGKKHARSGMVEAYLGEEQKHPWVVRTAGDDVVYVADGGLKYKTGKPVHVGDFA